MSQRFFSWVARQIAKRPALIQRIMDRARKRVYVRGHIYNKDGTLYMGRWVILDEHSWFPYAARLHHLATADDDRTKHDHPVDYRTIVIANHYVEEGLDGVPRLVFKGETVAHRAEHFHQIVSVGKGGAWTIFIYKHGMKHNRWGFLEVINGRIIKTPNEVYLNRGKKGEAVAQTLHDRNAYVADDAIDSIIGKGSQ